MGWLQSSEVHNVITSLLSYPPPLELLADGRIGVLLYAELRAGSVLLSLDCVAANDANNIFATLELDNDDTTSTKITEATAKMLPV